jgi:Zn-dependent protease
MTPWTPLQPNDGRAGSDPADLATTAIAFDALQETDYQLARQRLLQPTVFRRKTLLLVVSLLLFALAAFSPKGVPKDRSPLEPLVILVAVLLFHELGHYVGMRLFGYRDVKMFFIPFVGAAVSGTQRGVARWKQAVVLLLGPLPGIVVGFVLLPVSASTQSLPMGVLAITLLALNGLNLLPVAPLDGGQLFAILLFSRQRHLELAFLAIAGALLVGAGMYSQDWLLGGLGLMVLLALGHRHRLLRASDELRRAYPNLPADPAALDDTQCRTLFASARLVVPQAKPKALARQMEAVLERASQQPPSVRATLALGAGWCVGVALCATGFILALVVLPNRPHRYSSKAGGFTIQMPGKILEGDSRPEHGIVHASPRAGHLYSVSWRRRAGADIDERAWLEEGRDELLASDDEEDIPLREPTIVHQDPIGPNELRFSYRGDLLYHARLIVHQGCLFTLLAAAPNEEDSRRFLDSFQPEP